MLSRISILAFLLCLASTAHSDESSFELTITPTQTTAAIKAGVPILDDLHDTTRVFIAIINAPRPFDIHRIAIGVAPNGQDAYLYELEEAEWFAYNGVEFEFKDTDFPIAKDTLLSIGGIEATPVGEESGGGQIRTIPTFIYLYEGTEKLDDEILALL